MSRLSPLLVAALLLPVTSFATERATVRMSGLAFSDAGYGARIDPDSDVELSFGSVTTMLDFDYCFYISSEECFQREDSKATIEFQLTDPSSISAPNPSPDLRVKWEYWNGRRWSEICTTTPLGPAKK